MDAKSGKRITHKKFTPQDDATIREEYTKHGKGCFLVLSKKMNRSVRSIRERWLNYINISQEPFTDDEIRLLEEKVQKLGPQWAVIRGFFKGRSANVLRDKYKSIGQPIFKLRHPNYVSINEKITKNEPETSVQEDIHTSEDMQLSIFGTADDGIRINEAPITPNVETSRPEETNNTTDTSIIFQICDGFDEEISFSQISESDF